MNTHETLERLRTLVEDICRRGDRVLLPRLVLDVIEPFELLGFTEAFTEEFEIKLLPGDITDETVFRDLLELIHSDA